MKPRRSPGRWRAPRRLKMTRLGWVYITLTFGIGVAALNTGNNLLYLVLGFLLSIIVMSGVLSERALRDIEVRRLLPDGCFATEPFPLRYQLSVPKGRAFALRITERDAKVTGQAWCPLVEADAPQVVRAHATAPKRGPVKLEGIDVTTSFPLGLFEKTMVVDRLDTLLVYPRRGFVCDAPPQSPHSPEGDSGNPQHRDGTGDLLGLVELGPSEDARRVHWKKSAAAGKLLRVEREREARRQYTLAVDGSADEASLERACEETAAMAHLLLSQGHEVGLRAGPQKLRPAPGAGQERRVLTALAWLGFEQEG